MENARTVGEMPISPPKIRYDWLDAIKALAVTFVIFHHLALSENKTYDVLITHVMLPLFFAASGFTFNLNKADDSVKFFKSKFKRLVIPYVCLITLSVFIIAIPRILNGETTVYYTAKAVFNYIITGESMWFLPCLFFSECIMFIVVRLSKKDELAIILSCLISLIVGYLLYEHKKKLWMQFDVTFIAYPYVVFGFLIKKHFISLRKRTRLIIGLLSLALYVLNILYEKQFKGKYLIMAMYGRSYPDFWLDVIQMFVGTLALFMLFSLIKTPKFIACYGRNTLFYYAFHSTFRFYFFFACKKYAPLITENFLYSNNTTRSIYAGVTVGIILIMIPFCYAVNQTVPWIVGKTEKETNSFWLKLKKDTSKKTVS